MNLRAKRDTLKKKDMYSHPLPRGQNPAIVSILWSENVTQSVRPTVGFCLGCLKSVTRYAFKFVYPLF